MDGMTNTTRDVPSTSEQVEEKNIDTPLITDDNTDEDLFSMVPASSVPAKAKGGRKKKTT
jgi:hypothetical protein